MKTRNLFLSVLASIMAFESFAQTGNVGIGTDTPHSILDLGSSFGTSTTDVNGKKMAVYNDAGGSDFYGIGLHGGFLQMHAASTATEAAGMTLSSATSSITILGTNPSKAAGGSGTAWAITSDLRAKKNIKPISIGLNEILKIHPKTFQFNGRFGTKDNGEVVTGIIAQDLQKVLPGSIKAAKNEKGEKYLQLKTTDQILYALVKAIQTQQQRIAALKVKNELLKDKISRLETIKEQLSVLSTSIEKMTRVETNRSTFYSK